MVELGRMKIKKKAYEFNVKKRYQYAGHYRIKERPPIEHLKDVLRSLMAPRKEDKKAAAAAPPPPGGFNFMVLGAAVLVALIILAIGWIYLTTQVLQPGAGVFQPLMEKPMITNSIEGGEMLTSGDRNNPTHIAALLVDFKTQNLNNYTLNLTTYDGSIPAEVFILNSQRFEADSYPDFLRVLRSDLAKRKVILNEITVKELETMPQGAIVIVPSGVVPQEMLGVDSQLSMDELAQRGVVVVYIGQPFTKMLNSTPANALVVTTPQAVLKAVPAQFDESAQLESSEGFQLFQPLYRASPGSGWGSDMAYGSVSVLKKGDGAFIFVPQTLDGGWRKNYTAAADDIARIVAELPWATPNAASKSYDLTNQTEGTRYFFTEPFARPAATVKADFTGYSQASNYPVMETLFLRLESSSQNGLFIEKGGNVVPTNITGEQVRMNARLREPVAMQPDMYLTISDVDGTELQNFPQGSVNVQADKSFDVEVYVDKGEYFVKLADDLGKVYAETYMKVVSVDISFDHQDARKRSVYVFNVVSPFKLGEVGVSVDDGRYGKYTFNNVENTLSVDVGQYTGGDTLPLGNHTFDFTAGGLKTRVPVLHIRPVTIFETPTFWIMIILTLGIVGVGIVFARQEAIYFSIDIPDFPPVARTRIPLAADAVLGIFEKVNETYRWQCTPMTTAEIKNGFKGIFYQGKPVYITDYNVEYLLDELEKKGRVKGALGYYGLAGWEDKTKHAMDYLALMRRLRDICVNNAIPFTSIDESKLADSDITVVGQQMFVHFYSRDGDIKALLGRALATIHGGITIILFKSQADKEYFLMFLDSAPSVAPLVLKMEAGSGSLQFLTSEEFEKMLIEFKSM